MAHLPLVLNEERELVVGDVRRTGGVARDSIRTAALEVEQPRAAAWRAAGRATCGRCHVRAIRTADCERPESTGRRRRGIAQEADDAVEDIAAFEEAAEHLYVVRAYPLAAGFDRVPAV